MRLCLILAALFICSAQGYPYQENYSNEVRPGLKNQIKELMKRDLRGDLKNNMYTQDKQLHKDVLREFIEENLTADNIKQIVEYVSNQHEDFLYPGYVKIYEVIGEKSLGDFALFQLAYQVHKDLYRGQVMPLLAMFPLAVWSVFTSKTVCIKNRGYGEYMYAAADDLKRDPTHRNVFTWRRASEAGKPGDWMFQHIEGNHFHIANAMFGERFIAERDAFNKDAERRSVFTSSSHPRQGDVWALEMDGEDVFIKNVHYNEYLYALDGHEYDNLRRMVLTWVPKGRENCDSSTYQCRWFISLC